MEYARPNPRPVSATREHRTPARHEGPQQGSTSPGCAKSSNGEAALEPDWDCPCVCPVLSPLHGTAQPVPMSVLSCPPVWDCLACPLRLSCPPARPVPQHWSSTQGSSPAANGAAAAQETLGLQVWENERPHSALPSGFSVLLPPPFFAAVLYQSLPYPARPNLRSLQWQ